MIREEIWLGEEPQFDHYDAEIETEVAICGLGLAGVAAARAACEAGAKTVVFEKTGYPQGRSGQFTVIGGKTMREKWGIDGTEDENAIVNRLMEEMSYRVKQRILRHVVRHIGEDFDWYLEGLPQEGVYFCRTSTENPPAGTKLFLLHMRDPGNPNYDISSERFPCYPYTVQMVPSHMPVLRNNVKIAEETGNLTIYYKTPAKKLVKDGSGRVTGVIAQDYDGKVIFCRANKGVILATGDYAGDRTMLETYCPWVTENVLIYGGKAPDKTPINSGDGHRMGLWAGARMEDGPHCANAHNMGTAIGATPFLELDVNGERYMNEDCTGQKLENQIGMLPERTTWQIFDSNWPEQVMHMPHQHGTASLVLTQEQLDSGDVIADLGPRDSYASQQYIDETVEQGGTVKADTLEELVDKMGIPKEAALSSIARYNELAHKGVDEDFGKRPDRLFPIEQGPFYASKIGHAALLCTHGGLESDHHCHCLDQERHVIPGLYVTGNVQGNRFAVEYPTTMPGFSHAMCLSLGREAGRCAAQGI